LVLVVAAAWTYWSCVISVKLARKRIERERILEVRRRVVRERMARDGMPRGVEILVRGGEEERKINEMGEREGTGKWEGIGGEVKEVIVPKFASVQK